ncbi:LacI family DNA-binding transcriptional regulator [Actinopolymorpha alba]|uniref:LacI family DNA-binding transcriptional regulator n=1 Tax=Actinopolymorpha alba TaxID=533267 RepID=UPI0003A3872B|nr:substrate-binding domain-containing protein [Actinopolymorpha alba]
MATDDGRDRTRPATIYDVARMAEVSHQTVSRYLAGKGGIRPHNRERVEAALKALSYRRNYTARSLATNRTYRLAALGYELSGTSPGKVMQGASEVARQAGYSLDIVSLDPMNDTDIGDALDLVQNRDIEGILATAPTETLDRALETLTLPVPTVVVRDADLFERPGSREQAPIGLPALVKHLTDQGHRRIAHLAGPPAWVAGQQRADAYLRAMREHGLEPLPIVSGDWTARSGYAAAPDILRLDVTAVVAANDRMALGLIRWLHEQGIVIPGEMSVVGYDDVPEAEFFYPPLTTVRLDFHAIGAAAMRSLLTMIEHPDVEARPRFPLPELVVRASSGPVPDSK